MADLAGIDLNSLVNDMTAMMLQCAAVEDTSEGSPFDGREVIGVVHLTGADWSGSIMVGMPEDAARRATAALFFTEVDEVSEEEVSDAVGELANVLAGQAKGEIGDASAALSLPSVTTGAQLRVVVPGTVTVETKRYSTDHGAMTVSALARQNGGGS